MYLFFGIFQIEENETLHIKAFIHMTPITQHWIIVRDIVWLCIYQYHEYGVRDVS